MTFDALHLSTKHAQNCQPKCNLSQSPVHNLQDWNWREWKSRENTKQNDEWQRAKRSFWRRQRNRLKIGSSTSAQPATATSCVKHNYGRWINVRFKHLMFHRLWFIIRNTFYFVCLLILCSLLVHWIWSSRSDASQNLYVVGKQKKKTCRMKRISVLFMSFTALSHRIGLAVVCHRVNKQ